MSILRRFVSALKGAVWLVRPHGLRQQMNYVEHQLDSVHSLFDHWRDRFTELFSNFERQAQAVLPDVVERQHQLGDKLSQLNAGFGAREARLTKWLMEIEQQGKQLLEELKSQQEQLARLREMVQERSSPGSPNHRDADTEHSSKARIT